MKLPVQMPISGTLRGAHFAQVAHGGLVDLRPGVQQTADDDYVVEVLGGQQRARRLEHHSAAGGYATPRGSP